jgi:hypothetical protein
MDAKTIAAELRTAIRKATKTPDDVLHGLKVSVRTRYASMMVEIVVTILGLPDAELIVPEADREPGQGWPTDRAHRITERVYELGAVADEWADDRMHFFDVNFDGTSAPLPRVQPAPAAEPEPAAAPAPVVAPEQIAPACSKGHGPMALRDPATLSDEANYIGDWWECTHREPGITCRNSFVAVRPAFRDFLERQAAMPAPATPKLGTRRGHLASVS